MCQHGSDLMKRLLLSLAVLGFAANSSFGQAAGTVVTFDSARVTAGDALPGSNAVVTVSFKIQPGYYLHSNRPTIQRATPTTIQAGMSGATRTFPPVYSTPGPKTIPGNAQPVMVYEGGLAAQVPVVIALNATFPITLPGLIAYAPVNGKTHAAGRLEQVRFNFTIPRGTNAPPPTPKAPAAAPKKKK